MGICAAGMWGWGVGAMVLGDDDRSALISSIWNVCVCD